MAEALPDDERDAGVLLDGGWRQASVFLPPIGTDIPVHCGFDAGGEFLVVCTQSCSVVSKDFNANPFVEVLVARSVEHYNKRSPEAVGRNVKCFLMPVNGDEGKPALACDINRRCFLPRRMLLECRPCNLVAAKSAARSFAGWIARYYGRAALPNELVKRARQPKGPFKLVEAVLKRAGPVGGTLNEGVRHIYLQSTPDDELCNGDGRHYDVAMLFLCRDETTQDALDRALIKEMGAYENGSVQNGMTFAFRVVLMAQTFVADLDDYERFPDWDYLSGAEEARETYGSPLPEV